MRKPPVQLSAGLEHARPRPSLGVMLPRKACCLFSDIDGTMVGEHEGHDEATSQFHKAWSDQQYRQGTLVYNTGRSLPSYQAISAVKAGVMPTPQHLICGVGTRVYSKHPIQPGAWVEDMEWTRWLDAGWDLQVVQQVLTRVISEFGEHRVRFAAAEEHHEHKQTLILAPGLPTSWVASSIESALTSLGVQPLLVHGAGSPEEPGFVDVLPGRAGKGSAAEYVRAKLQLPVEQCVVAGDAFNDLQMLADTRWHAITVGNAVPPVRSWARQQLLSRPGADLTAGHASLVHVGSLGHPDTVPASDAAGHLVIASQPVAAGLFQALVCLGFLSHMNS